MRTTDEVPVERPVMPVAWADDRTLAGEVGEVGSSAAVAYWARSDWIDRERVARLRHPLYALPQDHASFEVHDADGMCAGSNGPREDALRDAMRFASVYSQDGPVQVFEVLRVPVHNAILDKLDKPQRSA